MGMVRGIDYGGTTTTGIRAVHAEWLTSSDGGIEQREKTSCAHSSAEQSQGQTHSPLKCTVYDQLRRASGMLCNKAMAASLVFPCLDPSKFPIPSMHKIIRIIRITLQHLDDRGGIPSCRGGE
jgi:hypothetical protein